MCLYIYIYIYIYIFSFAFIHKSTLMLQDEHTTVLRDLHQVIFCKIFLSTSNLGVH